MCSAAPLFAFQPRCTDRVHADETWLNVSVEPSGHRDVFIKQMKRKLLTIHKRNHYKTFNISFVTAKLVQSFLFFLNKTGHSFDLSTLLFLKLIKFQKWVVSCCSTIVKENPCSYGIKVFLPLQVKYKEDGMKSLSQSVYSQLPETTETQFAKTVSELQSQVRTTHTS